MPTGAAVYSNVTLISAQHTSGKRAQLTFADSNALSRLFAVPAESGGLALTIESRRDHPTMRILDGQDGNVVSSGSQILLR